MQDRLSSLELRVQQQEDEITVMKAALADVLRRLALSEDAATTAKKQTSTKGSQSPLNCLCRHCHHLRHSHDYTFLFL